METFSRDDALALPLFSLFSSTFSLLQCKARNQECYQLLSKGNYYLYIQKGKFLVCHLKASGSFNQFLWNKNEELIASDSQEVLQGKKSAFWQCKASLPWCMCLCAHGVYTGQDCSEGWLGIEGRPLSKHWTSSRRCCSLQSSSQLFHFDSLWNLCFYFRLTDRHGCFLWCIFLYHSECNLKDITS